MGMGNASRVCPAKWRRKLQLVKPTMGGLCYRLMVSMATVVLPLFFLLDEGPPGLSKSVMYKNNICLHVYTLITGNTIT